MKQVTIYSDNKWNCSFKEWETRWQPTKEELTPKGADILTYMLLPTDFVDSLKDMNKERVHSILQDYLPQHGHNYF